MTFLVNTSAFAGKEGKFVTSRNLKERLERELERNLALRVEPGESADQFIVSGRGSLHISILMENMRREGYEFAVGPPTVSLKVMLSIFYYVIGIMWAITLLAGTIESCPHARIFRVVLLIYQFAVGPCGSSLHLMQSIPPSSFTSPQ